MQKYRTTGLASFGGDMLLGLTKDQAAARAHALSEEKGGWRPTQIVQFKAGETLSVAADYEAMPGTLRAVLEPVDGGKAKAAKAKPDADAKAAAKAKADADAKAKAEAEAKAAQQS